MRLTRSSALLFISLCFLLVVMTISNTGCTDILERGLAAPPQPDGEYGEEDTDGLVEENGKDNATSGLDGDNPAPVEEPQTISPIPPQDEQQKETDEAQRREALGSFYVPLPKEPRDNPPVKARGIYVTGHSVTHSRYPGLLEMVESTELNTMVIDVKADDGLMSYPSEIAIVNEVKADRRVPVNDMAAVLADLKERDIYTIARVVVFRDPYLAEQRPDWAIQRIGGGTWYDRKGKAWVDPYERNVWQYNIAIAQEAALLGFREIQFDYVRFPENAATLDRDAFYPAQDHLEKDELIRDFIIEAAEALAPYDVYISADVFGVIATSWGDSDRIGQTWEMISPYVDYICPMVYPSHYGPGYFGFAVPDARPGETVHHAIRDSLRRNAPLENPAIIRPWLQNFTASWIRGNIAYGPREIRAQIEAAYALGIDEYLLWNANNRYQPASLISEAESDARFRELARAREDGGLDALGRTAQEAVEIYLEAVRRGNWREAYALQGDTNGRNFQNYTAWRDEWTHRPADFHVEALTSGRDDPAAGQTMLVDVEMRSGNDVFKLFRDDGWDVKMVNTLWRVTPSPAFLELLVYDGGTLAYWPASY